MSEHALKITSLFSLQTLSLNESVPQELQFIMKFLDLPKPRPLQPLSHNFKLVCTDPTKQFQYNASAWGESVTSVTGLRLRRTSPWAAWSKVSGCTRPCWRWSVSSAPRSHTISCMTCVTFWFTCMRWGTLARSYILAPALNFCPDRALIFVGIFLFMSIFLLSASPDAAFD